MAVSRTLVWTWVVALLAFSGLAGLRAVNPAPPGAETAAAPIFDAGSLSAAGARVVSMVKAARPVPAAPPVAQEPIEPLAPPAGPSQPAGVAGVLRGLVTSADGKPLAGVRLVASGSAGGAAAVTDGDGAYVMALAPGLYSLQVEAPGFDRGLELVRIAADRTTELSFALAPALPLAGPVQDGPPPGAPTSVPAPGQVRGRVVGLGGQPIAGATVTAGAGGAVVASARTNPQGDYVLVLRAGAYALRASAPGYAAASAQAVVAARQQVTVNFTLAPLNAPTPAPTATPAPYPTPGEPTPPPTATGSIAGVVTSAATGAPIADAYVRVFAGGEMVTAVRTDSQGRYAVTVPTYAYNIDATATGYDLVRTQVVVVADQQATVNFGLTPLNQSTPTPGPNDPTPTPGPNLPTPPPTPGPNDPTPTPTPPDGPTTGVFSGVVLDSVTRAPIRGATVRAMGGGAAWSATTDSQGRYALTVPAGAYQLEATAEGYLRSIAQLQINAGQSVTFDWLLSPLTAPPPATPTSTPTPGPNQPTPTPGPNEPTPTPDLGTLTGVVSALNGPPIAGAEVRAMAAGVALNAFADSQGRYSLRLPPGDYRLEAVASGYVRAQSSARIAMGQTVTVNWTLAPVSAATPTPTPPNSPATGALTGVVSASGGGPIAGATVRAMGGGAAWSATTDSQGRYAIAVPAGGYGVEATAPGFQRAQAQAQVAAGQSVTVDLTLPAGANQPRPATGRIARMPVAV